MPKLQKGEVEGLPAEDYELQASSIPNDHEPLLPQYERHPTSTIHATPSHTHNQSNAHTRNRASKFRRILSCLCLAAFIVIPSFALAGCWFGRKTLDQVRKWDQLPPEWKSWFDRIAPGRLSDGSFPTDVGYAGPTPTGSEAALLATAPSMPMFTGISPLVPPISTSNSHFNMMQYWGNLSPFYSVSSHGLPESNSLIPEGCDLEELHWLQRHGARYPTLLNRGPAGMASRLKEAKEANGWKATNDLEWLNDWEYKLGAELLTPFGRQQLFNLGVSARLKYGFLLDKMDGRLPVFRTESLDRMLRSAQNFATGFFGYPAEEQYHLEVMIEAPGFNCTLAPWNTCDTRNDTSYHKANEEMGKWDAVFLKDAHERLGGMMDGYDLTIRDVKDFMETCAYETVALGYSSFCNLFTNDEWKGFGYRNDIWWWYTSSFGYPYARAMGIGYVQELVSRLTHSRLTSFDSTTNSSFHDDVHFPLNDKIYVDFTHDTEFALLLPTLNLTSFAETGNPPTDKIPRHRSFVASKFCPFATNLQFQVLSCPARSKLASGLASDGRQIRLILNDAPVPLTSISGCAEDKDGMCPFGTFVDGLKGLIEDVDFAKTCGGRS